MLSRPKSSCKCVCQHMVTTGLQATFTHQNSTRRKQWWTEGSYQPDVKLLASQGVVRRCTNERERERNAIMCMRLTHTSGAICAGDVASWTGADIATSSVGAFSPITHTRDGAAFINIWKACSYIINTLHHITGHICQVLTPDANSKNCFNVQNVFVWKDAVAHSSKSLLHWSNSFSLREN